MADGSAFPLGINDTDIVTDSKVADDTLKEKPRLRMSLDRTAPLILDNTWKDIPFVSTNTPYDVNTFKTPRYNTTTKTILPNTQVAYDQTYRIELDFAFTHIRRPIDVNLRFVVPAPTPIIFPLPQSAQKMKLVQVVKTYAGGLSGNLLNIGNLALIEDTTSMTTLSHYEKTINSSLNAKQYGIKIQLQIDQAYTGSDRPQLTDCVLAMFPG